MAASEEMRLWLFDLAHGNLSGLPVVRGFIKHYALQGRGVEDVVQDIVFHTLYGADGARTARETLRLELNEFAESYGGEG